VNLPAVAQHSLERHAGEMGVPRRVPSSHTQAMLDEDDFMLPNDERIPAALREHMSRFRDGVTALMRVETRDGDEWWLFGDERKLIDVCLIHEGCK
jgi:hypothetical protein